MTTTTDMTSLPLLVVAMTLLLCMPAEVRGHGRMLKPPSRQSAFRLGFSAPPNYDDNALNCGGRGVHQKYKKCGLCGDPWDQPKRYERPHGSMVMEEDFILSDHRAGSTIDVTVEITADHKGYFEFHLCNVDRTRSRVEATEECFLKNKLKIVSPRPRDDPTRYDRVKMGMHKIKLQLPRGLTCKHCVLQWKYHGGNDWVDGCMGCGMQEEFYACADMSISR